MLKLDDEVLWPESSPAKLYGVVEFSKFLSDFYDSIFSLCDKLEEKGVPFPERSEKRQTCYKALLEFFLSEKLRFKYVFDTEQGSVYFTLAGGESLRFKKETIENGTKIKIEPLVHHQFFVTKKTSEWYLAFKKDNFWQEKILGQEIPVVDCGLNVYPFEFGILGYPEIVFTVRDNRLVIQGTKLESGGVDASFASGCHLGHSITKIFKA